MDKLIAEVIKKQVVNIVNKIKESATLITDVNDLLQKIFCAQYTS